MKSRIGIIGAMDEEIIFIKKRMSGITEHKIGIYLFLNGSIDYIPVVLLQSSVGKVNAAIGTTLMIEHYRPLIIINTGSAGAVEPSMQIGDIIIAQQILHHDVDTTAFGYAKGQIPKMPTTFDANPDLIEIAAGLGESLNEVNHNTLLRGIYLSRQDKVGTGFVTTFDIRMKEPNREPVIDVPALHTIEHLGATFLRNNTEWKERIIYFGPMGVPYRFLFISSR